jgi:hypothetical protein
MTSDLCSAAPPVERSADIRIIFGPQNQQLLVKKVESVWEKLQCVSAEFWRTLIVQYSISPNRRIGMNKNLSSTMTGVAVGVIAGTAAYMMSGNSSHMMTSQAKKLKKSTGRAIKNAGVVISSISELMR